MTAERQPPTWYLRVRSIALTIYGSAIAICVGGAFLFEVASLVARDTRSYSLSGNPFAPSSFPWYVIGTMRSMAVAAMLIVAGIGYVPCYFVALGIVGRLFRHGLFTGPAGRVLAAIIALVIEATVAAWYCGYL